MISRRNLILSGACVTAAATAAALRPRREEPLLRSGKLAEIVPAQFGDWVSEDVGDPYAVNGEGTLADKLYNELITRQYVRQHDGGAVLALFAYGGRQSDDLQLHRPEVCYPAFGYNLVRNEPLMLPLGGQVRLPVRRLAAEAEGRQESIIYWSRMGELLPQDGGQQRKARLELAMQGIIPDGLLSRFSLAGSDPEADWLTLGDFIRQLVAATPANKRNVLIGTLRARSLLGAGPVAANMVGGRPGQVVA